MIVLKIYILICAIFSIPVLIRSGYVIYDELKSGVNYTIKDLSLVALTIFIIIALWPLVAFILVVICFEPTQDGIDIDSSEEVNFVKPKRKIKFIG